MQSPLEIAFVDTDPSPAVSSHPGNVDAHEDIHVAVRDALGAMERQLQEWQRP
jgi:hypothetical protein